MRSRVNVGLLATVVFCALSSDAMAASLTSEAEGVRIEVRSEPDRPVTGPKTTYSVRLFDGSGKPLTRAKVTLTGRMADGMSVAAPLREAKEPGLYRGDVLFTMNGLWQLAVRVVSQGRRFELPLREEVGR